MRQGDPLEHGLDRSGMETIRGHLTAAVDRVDVPGISLLLARHGKVLFREAYGWADIEAARPRTADDLVWIGSASEPISATCVVRLAEQGRIDTEAPIQRYLPEFRGATLRGGTSPSSLPTTSQLLAHTSGLMATAAWSVFWEPRGALDPSSAPPPQAVHDQRVLMRALGHSLAEAVRRTARYHLAAEPGSRFAHSGAAFSVAGRVAEVAAGAPFDELLRNLVLDPLGMGRTTFRPGRDELASMPVTYAKGPSGLVPVAPAAPSRDPARLVLVSVGLASTLDDCARFLQSHLEDGRFGDTRVLSEASARLMRTSHTAGVEGVPEGKGYGLGWFIDRMSATGEALTVSHCGALGSALWIEFDRSVVGVLLAQMQPPTKALREATWAIQELVRDLIPPERPSH